MGMKQRKKWALEKKELEIKYGCSVDDVTGEPIKASKPEPAPAPEPPKPKPKPAPKKKAVKKKGRR